MRSNYQVKLSDTKARLTLFLVGQRHRSRIKTLGIILPAGTYVISSLKSNLRAAAAMETNEAGAAVLRMRGPSPPWAGERLRSGKVNGPRQFCHSLQRGHSPSAPINQTPRWKVLCFYF